MFIVGTGALPQSKEQILEPLGDSVFVVNNESPDKMDRWYETCPYLLSTSRYEGGRSYAILEGMAKGMVVFGTDIPSTREIITDNCNGILLSGIDTESDKGKILQVIEDTGLSKEIGRFAWRKASRHTLSRQIDRLQKVIEK